MKQEVIWLKKKGNDTFCSRTQVFSCRKSESKSQGEECIQTLEKLPDGGTEHGAGSSMSKCPRVVTESSSIP